MSEEERVAAFERLRERARQVREGAPQKSSARPEHLNPDGEPKATAPADSKATASAEPKASEANVYVDPSLMSLDEYYKQAGIELEPQKKGGFFSKIFGKK